MIYLTVQKFSKPWNCTDDRGVWDGISAYRIVKNCLESKCHYFFCSHLAGLEKPTSCAWSSNNCACDTFDCVQKKYVDWFLNQDEVGVPLLFHGVNFAHKLPDFPDLSAWNTNNGEYVPKSNRRRFGGDLCDCDISCEVTTCQNPTCWQTQRILSRYLVND